MWSAGVRDVVTTHTMAPPLAAALLLLLTLLPPSASAPLPLGPGATIGSVSSASWMTLKKACARTDACARVHPAHNENCVGECMAPHCYAEVYGREALEPGEIDIRRSLAFQRCLRASEKPLKRARMWPPRLDDTGSRLAMPAQGLPTEEDPNDTRWGV